MCRCCGSTSSETGTRKGNIPTLSVPRKQLIQLPLSSQVMWRDEPQQLSSAILSGCDRKGGMLFVVEAIWSHADRSEEAERMKAHSWNVVLCFTDKFLQSAEICGENDGEEVLS